VGLARSQHKLDLALEDVGGRNDRFLGAGAGHGNLSQVSYALRERTLRENVNETVREQGAGGGEHTTEAFRQIGKLLWSA
jgi:hypothetical protein